MCVDQKELSLREVELGCSLIHGWSSAGVWDKGKMIVKMASSSPGGRCHWTQADFGNGERLHYHLLDDVVRCQPLLLQPVPCLIQQVLMDGKRASGGMCHKEKANSDTIINIIIDTLL